MSHDGTIAPLALRTPGEQMERATRGRWLIVLLLALFAVFAGAHIDPALAQQPASPAASAPRPPSAAQQPAPSGFYAWIAQKQADYNQKLAATIREMRTDPFAATILLALLSFAYGILHAAGPGHGKAIISSYVLANERTVKRGIALSFLAAAFQATSAILLVGILMLVFQASGLTRKATEAWLETVSWGIVTLLGAWLLWGQVRKLLAARKAAATTSAGHAQSHTHHHDHSHGHHHGHPAKELAHAAHAHDHGHSHAHGHAHAHTHDHAHHHHTHAHGDHCDHCGHAHMPDPRQLEGQWSWSKAIALAAAVGIRPCTGAVFVLGFALSQGLIWAGIFATFAMALGTAITVSALAAIAVGSREWAARLGGGAESVWGWRVRTAAGLAGSFAVMAFGLTLFLGSLGPGSAF